MIWKHEIDRWNLVDGDDDQVIASVTHELLATDPELFERERAGRGWPELPLPLVRQEAEWQPLSLDEIMDILDGSELTTLRRIV